MFDGVDLEDSWVLGWRFDSAFNQLVFDLELSLWPGHQHYAKPLPGEYTCYKPGFLIFDNVISIDGLLPMETVKYSVNPDGSVDYENIEGLHFANDNTYKFSGDFGEVSVECGEVRLEIK